MTLFACTACRTIDNSALVTRYWSARIARIRGQDAPMLCSVCEGEGWHGEFERITYDPRRHTMDPWTRMVRERRTA